MQKLIIAAATLAAFSSMALADDVMPNTPPDQQRAPSVTAPAAATPNAATSGVAADTPTTAKPTTFNRTLPDEKMASKLIGANVYSGKDKLGQVDDLIVDKSGKVTGIVLGAGGVLGLGAKKIGVAYEVLSFGTDEQGRTRISAPFTRDTIEKAPAFQDASKS